MGQTFIKVMMIKGMRKLILFILQTITKEIDGEMNFSQYLNLLMKLFRTRTSIFILKMGYLISIDIENSLMISLSAI